MAKRVLDTNVLIRLWRGGAPSPGPVNSLESARAAAQAWLEIEPHDVIVTPVRIEFLAGVRDREELKLADEFLAQFEVLDDGRVLPDDWKIAERLSRRVPWNGRARDALDCLIVAICERLHADFRSEDTGLPRR